MDERDKLPKSETWVAAYDLHSPDEDRPTVDCMFSFIAKNSIGGFFAGGDQNNNTEVSPHTKNKPKLRAEAGSLIANAKYLDSHFVKPLENILPKKAKRVWLDGNHDHWIEQMIEEGAELEGLQTHKYLNLEERGWKYLECGKEYTKGKLTLIHGEQLTSSANSAKQAVEMYCSSVLFGHFHTVQSYAKVMVSKPENKWIAYCSPILANVKAYYLRNKPTSWVNGFDVIEFRENGHFNVYPVVCIKGVASYGGRTYRG